MRIRELLEARRNPELNNRSRTHLGIDELLTHTHGDEYRFVSFTQLPKLGINPQSSYNTPVGIYAYPMTDSIAKLIRNDHLPFAGKAPYMNVFRYTGDSKQIVVSNDADNVFQELNEKVGEYCKRFVVLQSGPEQRNFDDQQMTKFIWGILFPYAAKHAYNKTPAGIWWNFSRLVANTVAGFSHFPLWIVRDGDEEYLTKALRNTIEMNIDKDVKGGPAQWNHLMRSTGVACFVDLGQSIIHANEPEQAVFFDPRAIGIVDRLNNPRKEAEYIILNGGSTMTKLLQQSTDESGSRMFRIATLTRSIIRDDPYEVKMEIKQYGKIKKVSVGYGHEKEITRQDMLFAISDWIAKQSDENKIDFVEESLTPLLQWLGKFDILKHLGNAETPASLTEQAQKAAHDPEIAAWMMIWRKCPPDHIDQTFDRIFGEYNGGGPVMSQDSVARKRAFMRAAKF